MRRYWLPMEGGLGAQILTRILGEYLTSQGHEVRYDIHGATISEMGG